MDVLDALCFRYDIENGALHGGHHFLNEAGAI
jgi:hypothetical protein